MLYVGFGAFMTVIIPRKNENVDLIRAASDEIQDVVIPHMTAQQKSKACFT